VTFRGRRVEAWVGIASRDGCRLVLEFRTVLGMYVWTMPVLWREGVYHDLIEGEVVVIERWVDCPGVSFGVTVAHRFARKDGGGISWLPIFPAS
jgi:hypothetical protein